MSLSDIFCVSGFVGLALYVFVCLSDDIRMYSKQKQKYFPNRFCKIATYFYFYKIDKICGIYFICLFEQKKIDNKEKPIEIP